METIEPTKSELFPIQPLQNILLFMFRLPASYSRGCAFCYLYLLLFPGSTCHTHKRHPTNIWRRTSHRPSSQAKRDMMVAVWCCKLTGAVQASWFCPGCTEQSTSPGGFHHVFSGLQSTAGVTAMETKWGSSPPAPSPVHSSSLATISTLELILPRGLPNPTLLPQHILQAIWLAPQMNS